jgi:hypothetical protein
MARSFVDIGIWDPYLRYQTKVRADAEVTRIRDAFRAALDPDSLQTTWQVSDIFKWPGLSTIEGYAFVVALMDGGAPSAKLGPEWIFFWSGSQGSFFPAEFDQVTSAQRGTFFQDVRGGVSFGDDGQFAMHYAPSGGYGTGLDASGALVGGDFDAPAISPYTSIETFMPAGTLYGLASRASDGMTAYSTTGTRAVFVFDPDKPFVALYHGFASSMTIRGCWFLGEIVIPYRSTDTQTSGTFVYMLDSASGGSIVADSHWVFDDGGVQVLLEDQFEAGGFNPDNVPFGDGRYPWDVCVLSTGTFYKGYIDPDVVRVMGASGRQQLTQFDGGSLIKFHADLCMAYVPGNPSFPYPDPTGMP